MVLIFGHDSLTHHGTLRVTGSFVECGTLDQFDSLFSLGTIIYHGSLNNLVSIISLGSFVVAETVLVPRFTQCRWFVSHVLVHSINLIHSLMMVHSALLIQIRRCDSFLRLTTRHLLRFILGARYSRCMWFTSHQRYSRAAWFVLNFWYCQVVWLIPKHWYKSVSKIYRFYRRI